MKITFLRVVRIFQKKLFGKSSRKSKRNPNQVSLFDMEEITQEETSETDVSKNYYLYKKKSLR